MNIFTVCFSGSHGGVYEVDFWDVVPCRVAKTDRRFRHPYGFYHQKKLLCLLATK
jgi:hypothetical protein